MPGNIETFQIQFSFICPFCNKKASVGHDADGNRGVLHELPECPEFVELDPPGYISAVRKRLQS